MSLLEGKIGIIQPTFEEYPNRRSLEDVTAFIPQNKAYAYSADDIIKYFSGKPIKSLILINPDNPTGNYICKNDVLRICKWTKDNAIRFVLDESFVDFSDETNGSLIDQHILTDYKNLVVIKSISKSYGIPGLRLGVIASGDLDLISAIKKDVAIWDINSFAEFYMQIAEKYQKDYVNALSIFGDAKGDFLNQLKGIKYLKPFPTQANFVMCEILSPFDAQTLTKELLTKHNILIKDLSHKKGFDGRQYVRIAVKSEENNAVIIAALKDILGQVNV
jgi:histidinol-phosphate/aromatic aminotransferase/cobyric acid decarboxylase-like protein